MVQGLYSVCVAHPCPRVLTSYFTSSLLKCPFPHRSLFSSPSSQHLPLSPLSPINPDNLHVYSNILCRPYSPSPLILLERSPGSQGGRCEERPVRRRISPQSGPGHSRVRGARVIRIMPGIRSKVQVQGPGLRSVDIRSAVRGSLLL